ncbi:MAG: hypothetical protein AB1476_00555 [Candidatus Hadarchaeota archaeon]
MVKTIKVDDPIYARLLKFKGQMMAESGKQVSLSEAIARLVALAGKLPRPEDMQRRTEEILILGELARRRWEKAVESGKLEKIKGGWRLNLGTRS